MSDQLLTPQNPDKDPKEPESDELEDLSNEEIITILRGYFLEAENARKHSRGHRDRIWEDNIDLYWNRFDFSEKQEWQATEVLPEAPQFVNRFAASMRSALTRDGEFFTVRHPGDSSGNLSDVIKKVIKQGFILVLHLP